jgi:hypothetical protein
MNFSRLIAVSITALLVTGCAHSIKVEPNTTKMTSEIASPQRISANVGYFIPSELSALEITTPGGGGDNVRYFPYRDIENGYQSILSNIFGSARKFTSIPIQSNTSGDKIDFIFIPAIVTGSGGSGFFTWPPTSFTVDLTSQVRDAVGKSVGSLRVVGTGSAETGERLSEHGIAGRRAMEDALSKMQAAIVESKLFGTKAESSAPSNVSQQIPNTTSARLLELKTLLEKGVITKEEHDTKRKFILDAL